MVVSTATRVNIFETAESLARRGEEPIAVERALRDFRINLIFEGSSEIMRLFIAREAVDHHMKTAFQLVAPDATPGERVRSLGRVLAFYPLWYTSLWFGWRGFAGYGEFGQLAGHLRFAQRSTRRLARSILHAMVRYGPKLERRQMVLFRAVDIGAELYAIAAACVRAQMLAAGGRKEVIDLADAFSELARKRIEQSFRTMFDRADAKLKRVADAALEGRYEWLERMEF